MGLTPKQYGRIVRFRQIFNEIKPGEEIHWARLASQRGYFDQSHLAHDFQELMGQYPAEFAEDFRKRAYFIPGQMTKELIVYFKSESEFRKSLAMEGSDSKLNDGTDWGSNRRWFGEKLQYTGFDLA
jgi:AraC-like DNA-binding protein